jgi:hypothetical protein
MQNTRYFNVENKNGGAYSKKAVSRINVHKPERCHSNTTCRAPHLFSMNKYRLSAAIVRPRTSRKHVMIFLSRIILAAMYRQKQHQQFPQTSS